MFYGQTPLLIKTVQTKVLVHVEIESNTWFTIIKQKQVNQASTVQTLTQNKIKLHMLISHASVQFMHVNQA